MIERRPRGCREDPRASRWDRMYWVGSPKLSSQNCSSDPGCRRLPSPGRGGTDLFARPGAGRREVPAVGGVDWKAAIRIPTTAPSSVPASRTTTSRRDRKRSSSEPRPDRAHRARPRELEERLLQVAFVGLEQRREELPRGEGSRHPFTVRCRDRDPQQVTVHGRLDARIRERRPARGGIGDPSRPVPRPAARTSWTEPVATSFPRAMIATRSAICWTSERMWLETKTVRPSAPRLGGDHLDVPAGSKPLAGSSRIRADPSTARPRCRAAASSRASRCAPCRLLATTGRRDRARRRRRRDRSRRSSRGSRGCDDR